MRQVLNLVPPSTWGRASALQHPRGTASALHVLLILTAAACAGGPLPPAELSPGGSDACSFCRMAVSDRRTAAHIVAPGEEPRFFDDLGCLRGYLHEHAREEGSRLFVADHRTEEWVDADAAVYARVPFVETPMGSHLLAWTDEESRTRDVSGGEGRSVSFDSMLSRSEGDVR